MAKFNVGDIVISKNGKHPLEVTTLPCWDGGTWGLRYLHNNKLNYVDNWNINENYSLYETSETMTAQTLYSFTIDGETRCRYGTHIGTNSQNQYLIEEKGTGAIHVFDKKDLEEVVPYTFSASINGKETHYIGTPDVLKKGDVLLHTGSTTPQVAVVTGVDTKNKGARAKFKGAKIVTEAI